MGVDIVVPVESQNPLVNGASNPQQSAFLKIQNMNNVQAQVNKTGGVKKKRGGVKKKRGGGGNIGGNIEVKPTSTATMNVNGILKNAATGSINAQVNSEFDKGAFKGGSKTRRKSRRKSRRIKKYKKTRKQRH